jgi:hypothetical protein
MVRNADMPTPKLTNEIIAAAIEGFESQKRRIDGNIAELRSMLSGGTTEPAATPEAPTRKRKKFSAAARERMKEAQQRRWAKIRGESQPPAPATAEPARPKRKLTAAAKAKLVANLKKARAVKAAKAKAAAKAAVKAAPKKTAKRRAPVKKAAVKKTAPAAQTAEAAAQ